VVSADLDELRKLASRIVVLARGRIVADLAPTEASDERLGRLMLGLGTAEGPKPEVRPEGDRQPEGPKPGARP
jgi:ABC-type sugar transport system ATPase subunit